MLNLAKSAGTSAGAGSGGRKLIFFGIIFPIQVLGQVWVARYDGPFGAGGFDHAYAIAVDDSGYIYVTGESLDTNGWQDYATIKYNNSGDTVWVRRYDGPANCDDDAYAIAVDKKGNVYVTGRSVGIGTYYDYATVKYNSSGDTMWARRYNYSSSSAWNGDYAYAIAVDNNGNVYVTGRSDDSATIADYATIKYDSLGDTLWVRRYNGPNNKGEEALAVAIDCDGNVYVTGSSCDLNGYPRYATIKYDSSGNIIWVRNYNKFGYIDNEANAITVDNLGNVYVTGISSKSFQTDTISEYTTIKYNNIGDTMWISTYSETTKNLNGIKGFEENTIFEGSNNKSFLAYKGATALAIDNKGNVYVTGKSYNSLTNFDYATIKYDSSGNTVWIRRYNGPGNGVDCATGIAVDDSGNVYVTGQSDGLSTYPEDYATIKYSSLGNEEWVKRYNGTGNMLDCAYAIALDNKGYVYVTGSSSSLTDFDYATIKYSCVGVEEEKSNIKNQNAKLTAFPNPFIQSTVIQKERVGDLGLGIDKEKIKIYDIGGRLVEETNNNIIGKELKPGIYFIKAERYKLTKIVKLGEIQ